MNRRNFLQHGSLATFGMIVTPSIAGFSKNSFIDDQTIKKVHLIFKTHLDIGFTNLAGKIVKTYFVMWFEDDMKYRFVLKV